MRQITHRLSAGLAGWLLARVARGNKSQPRLAVIERIALTPRQSLLLVEAEGRSLLVATSPEGAAPVKHFMLRYACEKDLAVFTAAGQIARPNTPEDLPIRVVIPAYILSELKSGFAIGAVLFLPFLLIDIVTAAITTSIGMFQLPPVVVSTPLKILLFVMVDGWNLLASSLLKSF